MIQSKIHVFLGKQSWLVSTAVNSIIKTTKKVHTPKQIPETNKKQEARINKTNNGEQQRIRIRWADQIDGY